MDGPDAPGTDFGAPNRLPAEFAAGIVESFDLSVGVLPSPSLLVVDKPPKREGFAVPLTAAAGSRAKSGLVAGEGAVCAGRAAVLAVAKRLGLLVAGAGALGAGANLIGLSGFQV